MPRIGKRITLHVSDAQYTALEAAFERGNISEGIRALLAAHVIGFPDDLPPRGAAMNSERARRVRRGERKTTE